MIRRAIAAALLCAALAGCSTDTTGTPAAQTTTAEPVASPATLTYRDIGVDRQPLRPTGLDDDGAIAVPPVTDPSVVYLRWSQRLAPGRPTVLASHVNTRSEGGRAVPGVFARLAQAEEGDVVSVTDTAGRTVDYRVTRVERFDKDRFPASVYDPRPAPALVLITCTGDLEELPDGTRSYASNEVVTAEAT